MAKNAQALDAARELFARYLQHDPGSIDAALGRWRGELMYARLTQYLGQPAKAAAIAGAALKAAKPAPISEYQKQQNQYLTNGSYLILAENSEDLGQPEKALSYFSKAHDNIDSMRAAGRIGLDSEFMDSTTLAGMARQLAKLKRYGPAIVRYRQSIDLQNTILANGPNDQVRRNLIYTSAGLSNTLAQDGQYAEARRLIRQAVSATQAAVAQQPADTSEQRNLALYLTAAAKIERMSGARPAECVATSRALQQWTVVRRDQAAMPIDIAADGPITRLRDRLAGCG
jgi:tetratricopeptide (TPR) repeat protein